jgi:hypothetical protein
LTLFFQNEGGSKLLALEIVTVIAAFLVLVLSGISAARKAMGFGRSVGRLMSDVEPKTMYLVDQGDSAQRLAFSIEAGRDKLLERIVVLNNSIGKLRIIISAAIEAWRPVSRVLNYIGL